MDPKNPYAPPEAELLEPPSTPPSFFAVSDAKLLVLCTASLGLYELWWFYWNFRLIRDRTQRSLSPFWRALFSPFWSFSLFPEIEGEARALRVQSRIAPELSAWLFLLMSFTWRLPDPWWLISLLTVLPLLAPNAAARRVNLAHARGVAARSTWSGWELAIAVVGGLLVVLAIFGTFLPEPLPEP